MRNQPDGRLSMSLASDVLERAVAPTTNIAGKFGATLRDTSFKDILARMGEAIVVHPAIEDALLIGCVAFLTVPLTRLLYKIVDRSKRPFQVSRYSIFANFIAEIGILVGLVSGMNILYAMAGAAGLPFTGATLPVEITEFVYSIWGARIVRKAKKAYIERKIGVSGKAKVINNLWNIIINAVTALIVIGKFGFARFISSRLSNYTHGLVHCTPAR